MWMCVRKISLYYTCIITAQPYLHTLALHLLIQYDVCVYISVRVRATVYMCACPCTFQNIQFLILY